MIRAQVLTKWVGTGARGVDPFRPQLEDVFPGLNWTDVTAQPSANLPPVPNILVVEVLCDAATRDAIEADARFYLLHDEEIPDAGT